MNNTYLRCIFWIQHVWTLIYWYSACTYTEYTHYTGVLYHVKHWLLEDKMKGGLTDPGRLVGTVGWYSYGNFSGSEGTLFSQVINFYYLFTKYSVMYQLKNSMKQWIKHSVLTSPSIMYNSKALSIGADSIIWVYLVQ